MSSVIEVEGLRKEYRRLRGGRTLAVDGLDLEVPEGGVFGFLGPNGAGKTTTIRCLLGLVAPSEGRVRLLGCRRARSASPCHPARRLDRRDAGVVPAIHGPTQPARSSGASTASATRRDRRIARASRAHRSCRRPREDLLARHEAAAGHRGGPAQGSGCARARTSQRTGSTPPASSRCGSCCDRWAPKVEPSSCRATSCRRSSRRPTGSRSSPEAAGHVRARERGARRTSGRRPDRQARRLAGGPRRLGSERHRGDDGARRSARRVARGTRRNAFHGPSPSGGCS